MKFEASRAKAIDKLNNFIEKNLSDYSRLRNFDFGPDKRDNVSCISPYVTHGIINEIEIINKSLEKLSFSKSEKFIQEVLWRTYWKGWLELRPNVWNDYLISLNSIREKFKDNKDYLSAIEGNTNIECFNEWVKELKENNYLHNHARMWFASIWIFTLELPWELGAEFFLKHLYDGDAASNTLGWRWVAGIQTKGKNYLASEWNIKKFTNNRFQNIKLNEHAPPKVSEINYQILEKNFGNTNFNEGKDLLIFDNNLSFEVSEFKKTKFDRIYLVENDNEQREIKLSKKVNNFKKQLISDQLDRLKNFNIKCEILPIVKISEIKSDFYILYPCVGENLDFIEKTLKDKIFIYRKIDKLSWKYCNKGFFNFKSYIPKIVKEINV